jgi:hypothetical protein
VGWVHTDRPKEDQESGESGNVREAQHCRSKFGATSNPKKAATKKAAGKVPLACIAFPYR